ncbi:hypothetical protein PP715_18875 [Ralstonia solanacearum]|nr:hypothetical protein [Ralstonia solanacearum]AMP72544.1 hypothetical protein UW163_23710 [Ralstonia solanacearum]MCL9841488.1 hypothetical protein [Ralstonia solanacearum]MDB0533854.1 hypothetical protein [Ralstonia solanacearum]MDB0538561.1 hypothetical protein [Ralstonia solanacearum]MDB0548469.1 hypothetical protein [Ralstonia solanacearum]
MGRVMQWQATSRDQARQIIAAGMRCALTGEGLRLSAISECLRAMSYLCAAPTDSVGLWEPAASVRLTGMVRRRLVPLWPELAGEGEETQPSVMAVLNSLAALGDMVRLDGGRWLASPPHAVRAGDDVAVLLGGGPLEALPLSLGSHAMVAGRIRFTKLSAHEGKDGAVPLWEAKEWIGAPADGLQVWCQRLLAESAARLTDAPSDIGEVFVYRRTEWIPLADPSFDSSSRLSSDSTSLPERRGLMLCRTPIGQSVSYFLGRLAKGRLVRLVTVTAPDARRLRFGLDASDSLPLRVQAVARQGLMQLRLPRRLPERESKALLLGWRIPAEARERPGIEHHVFPASVFPIVRKALEGLHIVVEERVDERKGQE